MMRVRDLAGDEQPKSKATVHAGEKLIVGTALQWLEYLSEHQWLNLGSMVVNGKSHLSR